MSEKNALVKMEAQLEAFQALALMRATHINAISTVLGEQQNLAAVLNTLRKWLREEIGKCLVEVAGEDNPSHRYQRAADLLLSILDHVSTMHMQASVAAATVSGRRAQQEENVGALERQVEELSKTLGTMQRIEATEETVLSDRPRKIASHPESMRSKKEYQDLTEEVRDENQDEE